MWKVGFYIIGAGVHFQECVCFGKEIKIVVDFDLKYLKECN